MLTATTCRELLPARKSSIRGAGLTYDLATRELELVTSKKAARRFRVTESTRVPASYGVAGRAFLLTKLTPGTDGDESAYWLLVADAGPARDACGCKGFARHGHCSHLDGVRALIANGWVENPAERPTAPPVTGREIDDMAIAAG